MSPDSSFTGASSTSSSGVLAKANSVLMVAQSSASSSTGGSPMSHRQMSIPVSSSNFMAPLNLQKFDRSMELDGGHYHHQYQHQQHLGDHAHHHPRPTAIATAVIRVQVPECNSNGVMHLAGSPPSPRMVSVSTSSNGNGSHSPFMVPPPAAMYSNVIVMNSNNNNISSNGTKRPKLETNSRPSTPDYAKSYPVMEPVASSSSNSSVNIASSGSKGEPELNIGKCHMTICTRDHSAARGGCRKVATKTMTSTTATFNQWRK